jgi:ribosomal-protein-alanine N-acetyltransferase
MSSLPPSAFIRRMTLADLDRVVEIAESLKEAPQWQREAYWAAMEPDAAPRRIALVVEEVATGVVVGFAVASLLPPEAELEIIAVAPAAQRQGLARQLFFALAIELRTAGVIGVMLEVRATNQLALGLYRRLGFVETGRRTRYYNDPAEDAVLMRLRLECLAPQAN